MALLQPLTSENVPDESRDVLESVAGNIDHASNLYRVFAHSPSALRAYVALDKLAGDCDLSPAERQVVFMATSFENECGYCMATHSAAAGKAGLDEETIGELREGREISNNDRFETLRIFTGKVVRQRGHLSDEDLREFLEADFEQRNILDVILMVSMKMLSNYTNHVADTPLDERYEESRWQAPTSAHAHAKPGSSESARH